MLRIRPDGSVRALGRREALEVVRRTLGPIRPVRASHIEPVGRGRRLVFWAVRRLAGDEGRLAAWTRRWRCRWRVRIIGGPRLGPFAARQDAIAAELAWLTAADRED